MLVSNSNQLVFCCVFGLLLIPAARGKVSSSKDGVLPASLHLRHHGSQRGPEAGHQHQETDPTQHLVVQLKPKMNYSHHYVWATHCSECLVWNRNHFPFVL